MRTTAIFPVRFLCSVWFAGITLLPLGAAVAVASPEAAKDFFQNSDLTDPNNYSPPGLPEGPPVSDQVILTTPATNLTLNAAELRMDTLNQTNNAAYTISNSTVSSTNSRLIPRGITLSGATSTLTLQGPNGGDGIGVLKLDFDTFGVGQVNLSQPGATLNVSVAISGSFTKIGPGTLNVSSQIGANRGSVRVQGGVVNFLPGSSSDFNVGLIVTNPNTGAGSAVAANFYHSQTFGGIAGTIAVPSTGTNTATISLIGPTTELQILVASSLFAGAGDFAGTITGSGSIFMKDGMQIFSGDNTYTGTTTVGPALSGDPANLIINGTSTGQGDYSITGGSARLGGAGIVGLAPDKHVTFGSNALLDPGAASNTVGTLTVNASGTGGVTFGAGSVFSVDVAGAGVSDSVAINGGSISLTTTSDTLSLTSRTGAFDGTDYTIATFSQNIGGGIFNTVQGLAGGYAVQYNPTSIKLVAPQLPLQLTAAASRKTHGSAGAFDVDLLVPEPVECRSSGGDHMLVFTFANVVISGSASVTSGVGALSGPPVFSGKTMTVNLTGVADVQKIVVTLQSVTDRFGQRMPDTAIAVNMLVGDTTGNKAVTASDIGQTKALSGVATTASNFRADVTVNGTVTASDIALVKSRAGASIP